MSTNDRKILVPFDFSELSEYAVKHAVQIAKITESPIVFLNIIDDLRQEAQARRRLEEAADAFRAKYGVTIECHIRPGQVSTVIRTFAETINAFLVIMKTQKPQGKEKWFGTRTIRVIMGSKIPFMVIQAPPRRLAIRKVVFPIDFRKENKEKLSWISFLSKYYTSKIFLLKPNANDYNIRNNLEFSKRFLEGKNIDYEIVTEEKNYSSATEALEFSNKIHADLIIIMLSKRISLAKAMLGLKEQKYLSNDYNIPILCLNPRTDLRKLESFN